MAIPRREMGLLYRIRDLKRANCLLHLALSNVRSGLRLSPFLESHIPEVDRALLLSSKCLAIEEGKEESDRDKWGFSLDSLETVSEGRKRRCTKKTGQ